MRRPLIAANWKMHGSTAQVQSFLEAMVQRVADGGPEVVFCPPYPYLPMAAMLTSGSPIAVGAQSCHWAPEGAFTGEVAAGMLVELGARWVIVGHSERRHLFGETDATAARRARGAQQAGLTVVFCLGETLEQRDSGDTFAVLERQSAALDILDPSSLVVAYEPVWAIGTGRNATPAQAQEAHSYLRDRAAALFSRPEAERLRILYGGSMKPGNAAAILTESDVDGGLVGGASLDADTFWAIIQAAPRVRLGT
jgi:triosephosphate isomerase